MADRAYAALRLLRDGGILEIEGLRLKKDEGELKTGDLYIAQRNRGPKFLTVSKIDPRGWVIPRDLAYAYDLHECVKVCEA